MMAPHRFFISHYSGDRDIAELLATLLSKITLDQISPWFSSDNSGKGGITPGKIWFAEILERIEKSKALVAIITPNSISRPWLYFESGIAQSLKDCDVIPVCVGISKDKIYPPLGQYQCFQLSDYRSIKEFVGKLLTRFNIKFDEELSKIVLEKTLKEITKKQFDDIEDDPKIRELILDLKSHIDKRFIEIWERPNLHIEDSNMKANKISILAVSQEQQLSSYTVTLKIDLPEYKSKQILEIRESDTFSDIVNSIYFLLSDYINPYTYLVEWVIRDVHSNRHFIIREIMDLIPAKSVFSPSLELEVVKLKFPYDPKDSRDRIVSKKSSSG